MAQKPEFDDYWSECAAALTGDGDIQKASKVFEFNLRAAQQSPSLNSHLSSLIDALNEAKVSYFAEKPELLFYPSDAPDNITLQIKSFESAAHKLYRRNVLFNRNFPKPPPGGFSEPKQIYENIDDLLRTRLVCKYMDGPEHACNALAKKCEELGVKYTFREVSTEAGYYAWHFYSSFPAELMISGELQILTMNVELQFTTQLAEVITILTHALYEERRAGKNEHGGTNWKWDATSNRFRSAYLGHGLHLLEGVIQSLKDDLLKGGDIGAKGPGDTEGQR